jgi:hypothetical protein
MLPLEELLYITRVYDTSEESHSLVCYLKEVDQYLIEQDVIHEDPRTFPIRRPRSSLLLARVAFER